MINVLFFDPLGIGDAIWSTIQNAIRVLAFTFDKVVYSLIGFCYQIILYLSNIDLSNFGGVSNLVNRIYILLGIFMLFKLAFSIIQYIVSPDSFTDSGKGFGKLATNVMISMAMLVATPWLFQALNIAQGYILQSNIIGRLVMGASVGTSDNNTKMSVDKFSSMANDTEFLLYGAFASLNTKIITECENASIMGTTQQVDNSACLEKLDKEFNGDDLKNTGVSLYDFFQYKEDGEIIDHRNFGAFGSLINWQKDSTYVINYLPFISALIGGYVAFLLVFYCVDVALRAVKLLFLQMVAPISIISYVDPKESISNSKLSNWLKEVFSTWASLFIRLLTIFLVVQLISIIATGVFGEGSMINNGSIDYGTTGQPGGIIQMFIYIFLVVGCFQFAKKVPELIEKLFGIKASGELRIGQSLGAFGGGLVGGAIGSASGMVGAIAASRDNELGAGKTALNAIRGFGSGGLKSSMAAGKAGNKGIGTWAKTGMSAAARQSRAVDLRGTTSAKDRMGARVRNALGMQSKKETYDQRLETYDGIAENVKKMKEMAKTDLAANDYTYKSNLAQLERLETAYKNGKISTTQYIHQKGTLEKAQKILEKNYINNGGLTPGANKELVSLKERTNREIMENGFTTASGLTIPKGAAGTPVSFEDYCDYESSAKEQANKLRNSDKYENANKVDQYVKSSVSQKHMNS